jgi:hypothetical protein
MKRIAVLLISFVLCMPAIGNAVGKDLEIRGKKLTSQKPPFTLSLPSEFQRVQSSSVENPQENSLTRVYLFIKEKDKQVEEMLIVQIADKTNPDAEPMSLPALKPYTEKRMYLKGRMKKGDFAVDHLLQLMAWNPDAPSLQPIVKKGSVIPSHWALQGQFLFPYQGEHAVLIRYSKDVNSFGLKVPENADAWARDSITGNEKEAYERFHKAFMEMIDSIQIKSK